MDNTGILIKGCYRDVLISANNRVIHDSGWVSNTIVDSCRVLLTRFMKDNHAGSQQPPVGGIQYLKVGRGWPEWDTQTADTPDLTAPDLVTPYQPFVPVSNLQLEYLNPNDEPVANDVPTSRLQITARLKDYPDPLARMKTYPLREFGLFGGISAGPLYMINYVRHPVIHKDAGATLLRTIRLYF